METYTLRELSELSGVSVAALRKRCDRGQLRYVRHGGVRRVPRAEAEAVGLRLTGDKPADTAEVVAELLRQLEAANKELVALRLLPEKVEQTRRQVETEALAREAAEAELHRERAAHEELRQKVVHAGLRAHWRLRRELRSQV